MIGRRKHLVRRRSTRCGSLVNAIELIASARHKALSAKRNEGCMVTKRAAIRNAGVDLSA